jgi:hypothetical protein
MDATMKRQSTSAEPLGTEWAVTVPSCHTRDESLGGAADSPRGHRLRCNNRCDARPSDGDSSAQLFASERSADPRRIDDFSTYEVDATSTAIDQPSTCLRRSPTMATAADGTSTRRKETAHVARRRSWDGDDIDNDVHMQHRFSTTRKFRFRQSTEVTARHLTLSGEELNGRFTAETTTVNCISDDGHTATRLPIARAANTVLAESSYQT